MRRKLILSLLCMFACSSVFAGRQILLVTPKGVYQTEVTDGVPGQWAPINADVIVQGFSNIPPKDPDVPLPPEDSTVDKVAEISKRVLKDASEATAVAALVDAIQKMNLSEAKFREAIEMAAPIADTQLQTGDRIKTWADECLALTADPVRLRAGVMKAFDLKAATVSMISSAGAQQVGTAIPQEAVNWAQVIELIQLVLNLLKSILLSQNLSDTLSVN